MNNPIIVALDDMVGLTDLYAFARMLSPYVGGFKVSHHIDRHGVSIMTQLKKYGLVMSDLKINDIPSAAAKRVEIHADAGADFITVHASGGKKMLEACARAAPTQLVVVTVLSSLNEADAQKLFGENISRKVRYFAYIASESRAAGIVCSPQDLRYLDADICTKEFIRITPNVQPPWSSLRSDQNAERAMAPQDALKAGAHYIVIGRPIISAKEPLDAARRILQDIEQAFAAAL